MYIMSELHGLVQVLACANHVALYDFNRNQHRWVGFYI